MLGFCPSEDGHDLTSDITERCQLCRHVNKNKADSNSTRIWLKQVGTAASQKPPNPFGKEPSLKTASSRLGISQSPPQCPLCRGAELGCCSPPTPFLRRSDIHFDLTCKNTKAFSRITD